METAVGAKRMRFCEDTEARDREILSLQVHIEQANKRRQEALTEKEWSDVDEADMCIMLAESELAYKKSYKTVLEFIDSLKDEHENIICRSLASLDPAQQLEFASSLDKRVYDLLASIQQARSLIGKITQSERSDLVDPAALAALKRAARSCEP